MNLFDEMRAAANGIKPARNDQWIHTKETRLAILCGAAEPSPAFLAIAEAEAYEEQRAINNQAMPKVGRAVEPERNNENEQVENRI